MILFVNKNSGILFIKNITALVDGIKEILKVTGSLFKRIIVSGTLRS